MLHRPELELSDVRAPRGRAGRGDDGCRPGARHGAELELSDARASGAELELSDVGGHRAELEPSDARHRGRAERGDDGCHPGARHLPELELSDVRATGQSWRCRTRAPPSALAVGVC
jgi:hypothetical protein